MERDRLEEREISTENDIHLHLEIENFLTKATLIALNTHSNKPNIVREVEIPTREYFNKSEEGVYRSINGESLSPFSTKKLLSKLFKNLFENNPLEPKDIDFLSVLSDGYTGINEIGETYKLFREAIDACEEVLKINPRVFTPRVPRIAANGIKSRMIANGGNEIAGSRLMKSSNKIFIDLSTFLSGMIYPNEERDQPTGFLAGIGFGLLDALARGHSEINSKNGDISDFPKSKGRVYEEESEKLAVQASKILDVKRVPSGTNKIGKIPIDVDESYSRMIKLIGSDIGINGSDLDIGVEIGKRAASFGTSTLNMVIEKTIVRVLGRIVKNLHDEGLMKNSSDLVISGRDRIYQTKKRLKNHLEKIGLLPILENIIFVNNPASFGMPMEILTSNL